MRIIAVDWSGDLRLARSRIWLAEAVERGRLTRLECGRDRPALATHLLGQTGCVAIGLDFGFSFPSWFLRYLGASSAPELWRHATDHGEDWLSACEPPFWGRPGQRRPVAPAGPALRRAERAVPTNGGIGPKSVFQIGGAGAVGTGSVRGMPLLHSLHVAGATIWPFAVGSWPLVIEIYPRLMTGAVRKSNSSARQALLEARYPELDPEHLRLGSLSEDAFDAAVSALVMVEHVAELMALRSEVELDAELRLEGRIWHPGWRTDEL
jgi:hypothetical protein